jgi:hypothetical protein
MRAVTCVLAALFAIWLAGTAGAQPVTIRDGWVAPGNWASIWLQ